MATGIDSRGPYSSEFIRRLEIHQRANRAGFWPSGEPWCNLGDREAWRRPDGVLIAVTPDELDAQVTLFRDNWWAQEAAKWTAP
jgi:hypothetical protein